MSQEAGIEATFFGSPDYVPTKSEGGGVWRERQERGILPDAQERFNKTLEGRGWRQITELADGSRLPTLDEWVELRIENRRGTKFFPCFVEDGAGEVFFVKTQAGNNQGDLDSLRREATILRGFNEMGYPSPKFYEYGEPGEETLAFIKLEPIRPEQGRVAAASEWREDHAVEAMRLIRQTEETPLTNLPEELKEMEVFQSEIKVTEVMTDLARRAGKYLSEGTKDRLKNLAGEGGEVRTVIAHGDMTLKNIVIGWNGEVMPVDFELAKRGFLGQDAGKLLTGLRGNREVFGRALEAYLNNGKGEIDEERLRALMVGMATENLVHLVSRVEYYGEGMSEEIRGEVAAFGERVEDALKIREAIKPEPN